MNNAFMISDQNFQIMLIFFLQKNLKSQINHFVHIKLQLFQKPG